MKHENMRAKDCINLELTIENAINLYCLENYSDTPDFILAQYLRRCLDVFNETMQARDDWYKAIDNGVNNE